MVVLLRWTLPVRTLMEYQSARKAFTGFKSDYARVYRVAFGDYAQVTVVANVQSIGI
jgi:hypothetical protein